VERGKLALSLKILWLRRFKRLFTTSKGRQNRRFLKQNFPDFPATSLDLEMLKYSEQQLDLMMRQFPPFRIADLDERIARFCTATGRFSGMHSALDSNGLVTIRQSDSDRAH